MTHTPAQVDASKVAIMGGSVRCLSTYVWGTYADAAAAAAEPLGDDESDAAAGTTAGLAVLVAAAAALL